MKKLVVLSLFLLSYSWLSAFGQEEDLPLIAPASLIPSIYIGPTFGLELVSSNSHLITPNTPDICDCDIKGDGLGFYGGLSAEYLLGEDPRNSNMSLLFNAGYRTTPLTFEKEINNLVYLSEIIENADQLKEPVMYKQELNVGIVSGSALFIWYPLRNNGLVIEAGFDLGFFITKNITEVMTVSDDNESIKFRTNIDDVEQVEDKKLVLYDDEIENAEPLRVGLVGGISYMFNTGSNLYIIPSVRYNYSLGSVTSTDDLFINSLQIGVSLRSSVLIF